MQLIRQNLVALTVATMCAATASASSSQGSGPAAPSAGKTTRIASGSGEPSCAPLPGT